METTTCNSALAEALILTQNTKSVNVEGDEVLKLRNMLTVDFGLKPITEGIFFFSNILRK